MRYFSVHTTVRIRSCSKNKPAFGRFPLAQAIYACTKSNLSRPIACRVTALQRTCSTEVTGEPAAISRFIAFFAQYGHGCAATRPYKISKFARYVKQNFLFFIKIFALLFVHHYQSFFVCILCRTERKCHKICNPFCSSPQLRRRYRIKAMKKPSTAPSPVRKNGRFWHSFLHRPCAKKISAAVCRGDKHIKPTIQRLLNCGARRAALRPYFLRSFMRGSRVRNPAAFSAGR